MKKMEYVQLCDSCKKKMIPKICAICEHAINVSYEEIIECELTKKFKNWDDTCKNFKF